jgi:GntR family transcriptional regulator, transcriptional repressor for pyruvate dehydrogenase complex
MEDGPRTRAIVDSLVHRTVFTPIREGSAVADTVARLGQAIALGLLRPGDQLPRETKLARSLGISVVTLRGGLAILREAGLVETRRGRAGGTFVSATLPRSPSIGRSNLPPEDDLRDFADYRSVVEGGAAGFAAERATDEQIAYLEELAERMDETDDFSQWSEADTLFHLILADASQSRRLITEVADLRARAHQISALWSRNPVSTMRLSNRGHRAVLRAVKARRPARAQAAMIQHVQSTLAVWLGLQSGLGFGGPGRAAPDRRARRARSD